VPSLARPQTLAATAPGGHPRSLGIVFVVVVALLIVVPLAELAVMIAVGQWIGIWETIALLLVVSLAGAWLVKRQGLSAWRRIRTEMRAGQVPAAAVLDGALVLIAGALLLLPGFLTDILALCLLVPAVRGFIRRFGARRITRRVRYIDAVSREMRPPRAALGPERLNP
jgi:UPF0716 protein FxsA